MEKTSSGRKTLLKAALWTAGIWTVLLVVLQIVLSPVFLTKVINRLTEDYIDGELKFGRASASVVRHFPNIGVTLEDVSLTYPSERFSAFDTVGVQNRFFQAGRGQGADTLVSVSRFSVSVNITSLLAGEIRLPYIHLSSPRIFAKSYDSANANWKVFKSDSTDVEDDVSSFPEIAIGRLHLDGNPLIAYCSKADSVFAAIRFERMGITRHRKHYDLVMHAKTGITAASAGRMRLPIDIDAVFELPKDTVPSLTVRKLNTMIAGIPIKAGADVKYFGDSTYVKGFVSIDGCKANDVIKCFDKSIIGEAAELQTDAVISMNLNIEGWYERDWGRIPQFDFALSVPESDMSHSGLNLHSIVSADVTADGGGGKPLNINVNGLNYNGDVIKFLLKGSVDDLLGDDPEFSIDGKLSLPLDILKKFVGEESGFSASGKLAAEAKGRIKLSQMNMYNFSEADLSGFVRSPGISFSSAKDTIDIKTDSLDIVLATVRNTRDTSIDQGKRMLAIVAELDSASINCKNSLSVFGKNISLKAQNDAAVLNPGDSSSYYPFGGRLDIGRLTLVDSDSCRLSIGNSGNVFKISPSPQNKNNPVLTLRSNTKYVRATFDGNRVSVRKMNVNATAIKRGGADIPRDSLSARQRKERRRKPLPDWLTEKDFLKSDFDFKLSNTLAKYYREWDYRGNMDIQKVFIMSPAFPLRTGIDGFDGNISNNEINLRNFSMKSGSSSISATGAIRGLRRAFLHNGPINLDLDIQSEKLNFNELLGAYSVGSSSYIPGHSAAHSSLSDEDYQQMVSIDTLENAESQTTLLVVPANLIANVSIDAKDVSFAKLNMSWAKAGIKMRERCVLLSDAVAGTNIGDLYFEGFYSSRTKQNIKTGFNLDLKNVTAEKVIDMVPAIDSLMPMLKSFKGFLDCELAATAQIDTAMNIIMPSLNGVMRVGGRNLALEETDNLGKIMKLLRFKDTHRLDIDRMSVEGIISDSKVEIFPFVLSVDRYSVAMSGLQYMDQTYKYHISVLKSPLLVRFGVNLWGNFDDMQFKIGKAKYKNKNIPVFSSVVDQTRLNLSMAIKNVFQKGAEAAIRENERQTAINEHKKAIQYENAAESAIVELSEKEKVQLEDEVQASEEEGSTSNAPTSLSTLETVDNQSNNNTDEQSGIH